MRVSEHFIVVFRTANRPVPFPANLTPPPLQASPATHSSRRTDSFQTAQVVLKTGRTLPIRWVPAKCVSLLEHASPARKTRKKTNLAKSCLPESARSHASGWPASTWPASRKSRHAGQALLARCPWPQQPSTVQLLSCRLWAQPLRLPITKLSPIMGDTSHKWDFTAFSLLHHSATFLYLFPGVLMPGDLRTSDRLPLAAGLHLGGKHGSQN